MKRDTSQSINDCAYGVTNNSNDGTTFDFIGSKFQSYTVPGDGLYMLEVVGGQGGPASNDSNQGGKGALMQYSMELKQGDRLRISVGGQGQKGTSNGNNPSGGGGGGASSIVKVVSGDFETPSSDDVLILIAGGGGGAASRYPGSDAQTGEDGGGGQTCICGFGSACCDIPVPGGTQNVCCTGTKGGTDESGGGLGDNPRGGAGGAGYLGDGGTHYDNGNNLLSWGGQSYKNGNFGGCSSNIGGCGGWGGGGNGGPAGG